MKLYKVIAVHEELGLRLIGNVYQDHYDRLLSEGWKVEIQGSWVITPAQGQDLAELPVLEHSVGPAPRTANGQLAIQRR